MADYVVIVPKQDELIGVEWGFSTDLSRPDERTPFKVELFQRQFSFGAITFALLDRQTNTYSSVLTADVIRREAPKLVFLVGTALGKPGKIPVGSVVVSDGVTDISEKRYAEDGSESYVPRGPSRCDELTLDAKDFIARKFSADRSRAYLRSMARSPNLLQGTKRIGDFITDNLPDVFCETIVSGNDYRMSSSAQMSDIWRQMTTARAYDMEAAGFALAAEMCSVPWLVVRGISDHGTIDTKSDYHRKLAGGIAGRFLNDFLKKGLVRAAHLPILQEPTTTIAHLRDEAYRLDGDWVGAMTYLDDDGSPVVFSEAARFTQEGLNVRGLVKSRRLMGSSRHGELEYRVSFSIARHGYAGGPWSETDATRNYFGVLLGRFEEDSTVLAGTWLGTHRAGVRRGFFKWYNTRRYGQHRVDIRLTEERLAAELIASFSHDLLRVYNDACKVA